MRWLLLKDLQILRRSPLLVALLLAYGGLVGALLGFAVQRDDTKPKVAFLNEVPKLDFGVQVGDAEDRHLQVRQPPVRVRRPDPRQDARAGDREGPQRRRDRGADHPARPHAAAAVDGQPRRNGPAPDGRGPLQRGEPAEDRRRWSRASRRAWRTPTRRSARSSPRSPRATSGSCCTAARSRCWASSSRFSGCRSTNDVIEQTLRRLPRSLAAAGGPRARGELRQARDRQPRPVQAGARLDRRAAAPQAHGRHRQAHQRQRLLHRARRGGDAHDHRAVPRWRHARARARGARVRPAGALAGLALGAAGREGAARRACGTGGHDRGARGHLAVRRPALGADRRLGARAARRRPGVRRGRHGLRRAHARRSCNDAAGDPGRAPVRVPRAHSQRRRRGLGLRRGPRRVGDLPVQAGARRRQRGPQRRRPGLAGPLVHLAILAVAYTAIARAGLRRFA